MSLSASVENSNSDKLYMESSNKTYRYPQHEMTGDHTTNVELKIGKRCEGGCTIYQQCKRVLYEGNLNII